MTHNLSYYSGTGGFVKQKARDTSRAFGDHTYPSSPRTDTSPEDTASRLPSARRTTRAKASSTASAKASSSPPARSRRTVRPRVRQSARYRSSQAARLCREGGVQLVQGGQHGRRHLRPAGGPSQSLGQGDGHRGHLRPEVGCGLGEVDPHPHHHMAQGGALRLQLQLGENAAQLPPVQDHVVWPLDPRPHAAHPLHRIAHRHRRPRRQGRHLLQGAPGAEEDRQIKPLPRRGDKGAAPAAPATGLLLRHHRQAVGGPGQGPALDLVVGGVHRLQAHQRAAHPAARQGSGQLPGGQPVRRALQGVAPAGGGGDDIPLVPQRLHGLPHRRPAHPQGTAHLLPRQGLPLPGL